LSSLNHLTVPAAMRFLHGVMRALRLRRMLRSNDCGRWTLLAPDHRDPALSGQT